MAVWPSSLPCQPVLTGLSGQRKLNKVSFQPEVGPTIDRRRGTATVTRYSVTLPPISKDALAIFEAFYANDLFDGVLPFTWKDPVTYVTHTFKFGSDDPAYSWERVGPNRFRLSYTLEKLSSTDSSNEMKGDDFNNEDFSEDYS